MKTPIASPDAPQAIGPYSQGIDTGDLVFFSGQIPIDHDTGKLVQGDITAQAERVLANIRALFDAAGLGLADAVKTTIFLVDLADFGKVNAVYAAHFPEPYPARSTIQVAGLPLGARVEIEVMARRSR